MSSVEPGIITPITTDSAQAVPPPPPISVRRRPLSIEQIVIPTEKVILNGVAYEMHALDTFGPTDQQRIVIHWNEINEILGRIYGDIDNATTADDAELDLAYNKFFALIIPTATDVIKTFYLVNKRKLYDHFLDYHTWTKEIQGEITPEMAARLTEAIASTPSSESHSTGDTVSPDSPASTDAASPSAG